jgi:hypothetical protein
MTRMTLYAIDPERHLRWHNATDDGRTVGWSCEQPDCPRSEHSAEPASELDLGLGQSPHVLLCRVCHRPVRTANGGLHPVHARA